MFPESLKLVDSIDTRIAKDIETCSNKRPLTWDPIENYSYLNEELAFPSIFKYFDHIYSWLLGS